MFSVNDKIYGRYLLSLKKILWQTLSWVIVHFISPYRLPLHVLCTRPFF